MPQSNGPVGGGNVPQKSAPFSKISAAVGWVVGVLVIIGGLANLFGASGYPPAVIVGMFLLLAGALVLPPVTAIARRMVPALRPVWAPPLVFILLVLVLNVASRAVEPHGAARQVYIDKAIASADADIKAHNAFSAQSRLSPFTADAASSPALKAAFARVNAEQAAEQAPATASSTAPATTAASGQVAAQAEFERVNIAFLAAVLPCQLEVQLTANAVHSGDNYRTYDVASQAKQACMTAWENANATQFSDAVMEPSRDKLNADLKNCSQAYLSQATAMDEVTTVANGDVRPSTVAQARYGITQASAEVTACITTYKDDVVAAGLKLPGAANGDPSVSGRRHHHRAATTG